MLKAEATNLSPMFCPRCSALREAKPISYDEDCEIHGVEFTFHVDAFECLTCGE